MLPEQNLPWWRHDRPWGFRFSGTDFLIFAGGVLSTLALWPFIAEFSLIVPYLLFHFFLFCNTFRIGGVRSLVWVFSFLLNAYCWVATQNLALHLIIQMVITLALILQCLLDKQYHGFLCGRVNPLGFRTGALTEGTFTRTVLLACRVPKTWIEFLTGRRLEEFHPPSK